MLWINSISKAEIAKPSPHMGSGHMQGPQVQGPRGTRPSIAGTPSTACGSCYSSHQETDCPSQKLHLSRYRPPSSQFRTGFVNRPRQTVLMLWLPWNNFILFPVFLPPKPQALSIIFALKGTSRETKWHQLLFKHVKQYRTFSTRAADTPSHKSI